MKLSNFIEQYMPISEAIVKINLFKIRESKLKLCISNECQMCITCTAP